SSATGARSRSRAPARTRPPRHRPPRRRNSRSGSRSLRKRRARRKLPALVKAALLGIVQGLTEFLPVSSTAHLLIAEAAVGFADPGGVFTVMIQLGSILAVVWLYREKIWSVVAGLPSSAGARRFAFMIFAATVPLLVVGGLFGRSVRAVLYGNFVVMAAAFVVGGIVMLIVERLRPAPDVFGVDSMPLSREGGIG